MNENIKVGDKVRVIGGDYNYTKIGSEGIIKSIGNSIFSVEFYKLTGDMIPPRTFDFDETNIPNFEILKNEKNKVGKVADTKNYIIINDACFNDEGILRNVTTKNAIETLTAKGIGRTLYELIPRFKSLVQVKKVKICLKKKGKSRN